MTAIPPLEALEQLTNPHIFLVSQQKAELANIVRAALRQAEAAEKMAGLLKHITMAEVPARLSDDESIGYLQGYNEAVAKWEKTI